VLLRDIVFAPLSLIAGAERLSLSERIAETTRKQPLGGWSIGGPVVIFDCNGVLVDSEPIAAAVASEEFTRIGVPLTPENITTYFAGRRPSDMFAMVEAASRKRLPMNFSAVLAAATLKRFRAELQPIPHVSYAMTWLRGPKCVASSSSVERIRVALETTNLARFFEPHLFSAGDVANGKPAPDLFFYAASMMGVQPSDCIVVEDSPAGVAAAVAAGMAAIGFVGGSQARPNLSLDLMSAGARTVIADMRALKSTIVSLRGW
jgi:HAD superfamily hydrolase (TIGR01509 family)